MSRRRFPGPFSHVSAVPSLEIAFIRCYFSQCFCYCSPAVITRKLVKICSKTILRQLITFRHVSQELHFPKLIMLGLQCSKHRSFWQPDIDKEGYRGAVLINSVSECFAKFVGWYSDVISRINVQLRQPPFFGVTLFSVIRCNALPDHGFCRWRLQYNMTDSTDVRPIVVFWLQGEP